MKNLINSLLLISILTSLFCDTISEISDTGNIIVPSPPENISVTPGFETINLNWDVVPDATLYKIYWSLTPSVTKTNSYEICSNPPFNLINLTNFTPYYMRVTATNSIGESQLSSEVSAMPVDTHSIFDNNLILNKSLSWEDDCDTIGSYLDTGNALVSDDMLSATLFRIKQSNNQELMDIWPFCNLLLNLGTKSLEGGKSLLIEYQANSDITGSCFSVALPMKGLTIGDWAAHRVPLETSERWQTIEIPLLESNTAFFQMEWIVNEGLGYELDLSKVFTISFCFEEEQYKKDQMRNFKIRQLIIKK